MYLGCPQTVGGEPSSRPYCDDDTGGSERTRRRFAGEIAEATDDELWLVGESGGEVVAFERAVVWRPDDDAKRSLVVDDALTTLKIGLLIVKPSARRSGIGTALTSVAELWGRDRGAFRAVVIAMSDSPTAVPFYRSRGFRPMSTGLWKPL
jgi:GNAT superfamily N-acetyltransferase